MLIPLGISVFTLDFAVRCAHPSHAFPTHPTGTPHTPRTSLPPFKHRTILPTLRLPPACPSQFAPPLAHSPLLPPATHTPFPPSPSSFPLGPPPSPLYPPPAAMTSSVPFHQLAIQAVSYEV